MKVGIVGLGRAGSGVKARLRDRGVETLGYDRDPGRTEASSLSELVERLDERPRTVWTLVPAGAATGAVIVELADLLTAGDLIVDGGRSDFRDSMWRAAMLAGRGISFVDVGLSRGATDEASGYCVVVGGGNEDVARLRPMLEAIALEGGLAHLGPVGSGHYAKMVEDGIEDSLVQAYAEGYELLAAADLHIDVAAAVGVWRNASVVRSRLLELLGEALVDDPHLEQVSGDAKEEGLGVRAIREAVRLAVPVPALSATLQARLTSLQGISGARRVVAVLRRSFGDRL
ncbi:MAG: NADP-dependent phosphogluconate dehydrogenase [Actinomycetota bacterium]|nr:NADP-dependent phosphogluconate dehydrogenase [Actinomycetota bacterium]